MVLREVLQHIVTEDITGDILRLGGVVEENTREMVVLVRVVIVLEGHVLRGYFRYRARSHHVVRMNGVETHEVGENLVLVLINDTFLFAYVHHRQYLLTAHCRFVVGEEPGNQLHQYHQRVEHINHQLDQPCGRTHQLAPIGGSDDLWYDLREDEDQHRRDGGRHAEPFAAEHNHRLCAYTGGTKGVGNRIQRQDSR